MRDSRFHAWNCGSLTTVRILAVDFRNFQIFVYFVESFKDQMKPDVALVAIILGLYVDSTMMLRHNRPAPAHMRYLQFRLSETSTTLVGEGQKLMFRAANHVRLTTNAIPVYLFRRTIGRSASRHEEDHFSEIPTASSSKRRKERRERKEEEKEEK